MTLSADVFVGIFLSICTCIDLIRLIFNAQLPSQFIYLHLNRQDSYISKMSLLTEKPFLSSPALKGNKTFHPIKKTLAEMRCDDVASRTELDGMFGLASSVCRKAKLNVDGERMEAPKHCSLSRNPMLQVNVSRQMLH